MYYVCVLAQNRKQDFTNASAGNAGRRLLIRFTEFANLCLTGRVLAGIQPVFCDASLGALNKRDGCIRPIAVSTTLRHFVAKSAKMAERFLPAQLGLGVTSD
jgi:hypothetical protein